MLHGIIVSFFYHSFPWTKELFSNPSLFFFKKKYI